MIFTKDIVGYIFPEKTLHLQFTLSTIKSCLSVDSNYHFQVTFNLFKYSLKQIDKNRDLEYFCMGIQKPKKLIIFRAKHMIKCPKFSSLFVPRTEEKKNQGGGLISGGGCFGTF